jgi:hypothetical protein
VCVAAAKKNLKHVRAWGFLVEFSHQTTGPNRLGGSGGGFGGGPAQPVGARSIHSALGSCRRHKGHLVTLLGSLNNSVRAQR